MRECMSEKQPLVVLVAPNVSEQMGGEAIKALQIFRELKKQHHNTIQITHGRCRDDVERLRLEDVYFVNDTALSLIMWRSVVLRPLIDAWFALKAIRFAERLAMGRGLSGRQVIIHQTEPNSPVLPRFVSPHHSNVFGPINGNIYYPAIFRHNEGFKARWRRRLHMPAQAINRLVFHGKTSADVVLYAGGERTRISLLAGGFRANVLLPSLDSGVADHLLDRPRPNQTGENPRFVHFGRLVFHKGTTLAIEALAATAQPITLDIIGRGPQLQHCKHLTKKLHLEHRVNFLDWLPSHEELLSRLENYRGMVLPSIEDANGIVVQEAMAIGIPPICLDWGGPQLLIKNGISGFLISPSSREEIVQSIAQKMDALASDAALANSISSAAKSAAEEWRWSKLARSWLAMYDAIQPELSV